MFKTRISFKNTNVDVLSVTSPRTNNVIHIYQAWIPDIAKPTAEKIFTAWFAHVREGYENQKALEGSNVKTSGVAWYHRHMIPCYVELTAEDFQELYRVYKTQSTRLRKMGMG